MINVKIKNEQSGVLLTAARELAEATFQANHWSKRVDGAKAVIASQLDELRAINLATLDEGETVLVMLDKSAIKIDRRGRDGIDIKSLRVNAPEIAEKYAKRTVASYFSVMQ